MTSPPSAQSGRSVHTGPKMHVRPVEVDGFGASTDFCFEGSRLAGFRF